MRILLSIATITCLILNARAAETPPLPATSWNEAQQALKEERWDTAIAYFNELLQANPQNYYAYYLLGSALHRNGNYNEALNAHFIASRFSQARGRASFNAARSYALLQQPEMALLWVERALIAGFDDFEKLRSEADLALVRKDARFEKILSRAAASASHKMPLGTSHHVSPYDQSADRVTVRTIGGELPFGTGGAAVSASGEVFVADFAEHLYRFDRSGNRKLIASGLQGASGNAFDSHGNLYQAHFRGNRISKISPDGSISDFVSDGLRGPVGIAVDRDDNLYVANCDGQYISRIDPKGEATVFSRSPLFYCPNGITLDDEGNVFVANYHHGVIVKITPDGKAGFFRQMPQEGAAYILYSGGALYVTGSKSHLIFKLDKHGAMSIIAGTGQRGLADGDGRHAMFADSNGLAASPNGNCLYTNDGIGDWRDSQGPAAFPWHSALREIKLDSTKGC